MAQHSFSLSGINWTSKEPILEFLASPALQVKLSAISAVREVIKDCRSNSYEWDIRVLERVVNLIRWNLADNVLSYWIGILFSSMIESMPTIDLVDQLRSLIVRAYCEQILIKFKARKISDFPTVANALPKLFFINDEILNEILHQSNSRSWLCRFECLYRIDMLASIAPRAFKPEVFHVVANLLYDEDVEVRTMASKAMISMSNCKPHLIDVALLTCYLKDAEALTASVCAAETIQVIAQQRADALHLDICQTLLSKLTSADASIRNAAARALGELGHARPDLISDTVLILLLSQLSDADVSVQAAASMATAYLGDIVLSYFGRLLSMMPPSSPSGEVSGEAAASSALAAAGAIAAASAVESLATHAPACLDISLARAVAVATSLTDPAVRVRTLSAVDAILTSRPDLLLTEPDSSSTDPAKHQLEVEVSSKIGAGMLDGSASVRRAAIRALKSLLSSTPQRPPPPGAFSALLTSMGDRDAHVRASAVSAMSVLASTRPSCVRPELGSALVTLLTDNDSDVRFATCKCVWPIGKSCSNLLSADVLLGLLSCLSSEAAYVRGAAAGAVRSIALWRRELLNEGFVSVFLARLFDPSAEVSAAVGCVLQPLATSRPDLLDTRLSEVLVAAMTDSHSEVRAVAARAVKEVAVQAPFLLLNTVTETLSLRLRDNSATVRAASIHALVAVAISRPELLVVENVMCGLPPPPRVVGNCFCDDSVEPAPQAAPKHSAGSPSLVLCRALAACCKDFAPSVRAAADAAVRTAAHCVPEILNDTLLASLAEDMQKGDLALRSNAVRAVGYIIDSRPDLASSTLLSSLYGLLGNPDVSLRAGAATVLGSLVVSRPNLFSSYIASALLTRSCDEDPYVRLLALKAIEALIRLRPDLVIDVRTQATASSATASEVILSSIVTRLDDSSSTVCAAAAEAIFALAEGRLLGLTALASIASHAPPQHMEVISPIRSIVENMPPATVTLPPRSKMCEELCLLVIEQATTDDIQSATADSIHSAEVQRQNGNSIGAGKSEYASTDQLSNFYGSPNLLSWSETDMVHFLMTVAMTLPHEVQHLRDHPSSSARRALGSLTGRNLPRVHSPTPESIEATNASVQSGGSILGLSTPRVLHAEVSPNQRALPSDGSSLLEASPSPLNAVSVPDMNEDSLGGSKFLVGTPAVSVDEDLHRQPEIATVEGAKQKVDLASIHSGEFSGDVHVATSGGASSESPLGENQTSPASNDPKLSTETPSDKVHTTAFPIEESTLESSTMIEGNDALSNGARVCDVDADLKVSVVSLASDIQQSMSFSLTGLTTLSNCFHPSDTIEMNESLTSLDAAHYEDFVDGSVASGGNATESAVDVSTIMTTQNASQFFPVGHDTQYEYRTPRSNELMTVMSDNRAQFFTPPRSVIEMLAKTARQRMINAENIPH